MTAASQPVQARRPGICGMRSKHPHRRDSIPNPHAVQHGYSQLGNEAAIGNEAGMDAKQAAQRIHLGMNPLPTSAQSGLTTAIS